MKKASTISFLTAIIIFLSGIFIAIQSSAQQVEELATKLAAMKASPDPAIRAEGLHLESLVYNVQPTLYFENRKLVMTPGDSAVKINTDVASLNLVKSSVYSQVEIISIAIENPQDLQMQLDLSSLAGYEKLKYVFFLCTFDICPGQLPAIPCETWKISQMVNFGSLTRISVVYSVSIPS